MTTNTGSVRRGEALGVVARLAGFGLGAVVAFGVGLGVGAAVGPIDDPAPARHGHPMSSTTMPAGATDRADHTAADPGAR
jgi:hypothetical protein